MSKDKKKAKRAAPRPDTGECAVAQVTDRYSEYPSEGLTPVRLAEIFKEADAGDVLRQAELFEEMEEKDPHLFSQLQTRKNAVTGLDYEIIPFDPDDPRDKAIAEFIQEQIGGIEGFEDILLDLLDAIGKGFAVSEIMWRYDSGQVHHPQVQGSQRPPLPRRRPSGRGLDVPIQKLQPEGLGSVLRGVWPAPALG